jgi:tetratricopeptide (TPR) repeat protein
MTGHTGLSRLVLTSRTPPPGLDDPAARVLVEPVHALSVDEAALLAGELPALGGLLHADRAPARHDLDAAGRAAQAARVAADRLLVRRALRVVQGHPKLLELADAAAAAGRDVLKTRVAAAEAEAERRGRALAAFFADGDSTLDADGFFGVLSGWVAGAVGGLSGPARLLLEVICCLEDDDRTAPILKANWADVWRRLGRDGDPPDADGLVDELAGAALVAVEPPPADGANAGPVAVGVHPGVAEAVRAAADQPVRAAADAELAAFWEAVFAAAVGRDGGEDGRLAARAGLSAAPYLLRLHAWDQAGRLLEQAHRRSPEEPGTVQAVLPLLGRVADAAGAPDALGVYGRVLARVDPAGAEAALRDALARAQTAGGHRTASGIAGALADLLADRGRLREALAAAETAAGHSRRAGLGTWTRAGDEARRLQILRRLGQARRASDGAGALLARLDALPAAAGPDDTADPWNVRETVLQLAALAARDLGRWEQALAFNARTRDSMRARGAGAHETARTRFGDYWPLLRLGRLDDADPLLADCQQAFADAGDADMLGRTFSARAGLAARRGRHAEAARLAQVALRLKYTRPDPASLAVSHNNLAEHLHRAGDGGRRVLAHRLAAALLDHLPGTAGADQARTLRLLAADLARHPDAEPPAAVAAVAAVVEQVEGVAWAELVDALAAAHGLDRPAADAALAEIVHAARALPADQAFDVQGHLDRWQPNIAAIAAAARGDAHAAAEVEELLTALAGSDDWAALAAALRRVLAGERDHAQLTAGLDPVDTAILAATLDRLAAPPTTPPVND